MEKIFIAEDGQRIELTGEALETYLAQREKDLADLQKKEAQRLENEAKKQAVLERLGITEEEAKLILS